MTDGGKVGILILCAIPAAAQFVVSTQAGLIHFLEGDVYVDAQPVRAPGRTFTSLKDGQVLKTGRGRVEVLLAPAVFLRLGSQGSLRMVNTSLEDTRVELLKGRALVEVVDTIKGDRIEIKLGQTSTEFKGRGLYRFDADRSELRVFGGEAEARAADKKVAAGRGRAIQLSGSLSTSKFDPKKIDGLHRWAARRSFYLFASSPEAWARRTDWEFNPIGWFWNRNFDMKAYSAPVAAAFRRKIDNEERQRILFEQQKRYCP
jgi:hypothetical protein